ncbi:hypothetical protein [Asticcacaulis excentricus]|uniref:hypothetical protein n=1 Tax=Asticcacaulis excentricus TaxID=78587 RepID=UPI0018D574BB|nr:hypothetical protein [Asticcacaulis excentricus]
MSFLVTADEYNSWVLPVIDDLPLTELIEAYERENGYTDPAGGYGPIRCTDLDFSRQTINLLACECGETGCWPLKATLSQKDDWVVWSEFRQPHRSSRDYSGFGPFQFLRSDHDAAVKGLCLDGS